MSEPPSDSFATFYEASYRPVFRYVLLGGGPRDDVEDVAADAFAQAYRAWLDGRGPRDGSGLAWILTIARRVRIDHARRARHRAGVDVDERVVDPRWEQGVRETWLWFDEVSRVLPPEAREALILRYAGGLTADEIGSILGLTGSGVRSLIRRAMATLRPLLEEEP
jgi:RNA polymerase sigma-70 factor (ECF subfamily)